MSGTVSAAGSVAVILPHDDFITAPQFVAHEASDAHVGGTGDDVVGRPEGPVVGVGRDHFERCVAVADNSFLRGNRCRRVGL